MEPEALSFRDSLTRSKIPWFWVGIAGLFCFSLALRFWGISRFNTLVFDETIYVRQANGYLTHTFFFSDHPPISKYSIALGIWLDTHNPLKHYSGTYPLSVSELNAYSYRWTNALIGSFVPVLIAGIAYQLSHRRSYALWAGLLAAVDGYLLVESRYALNNIHLVFFGTLGQFLFLIALNRSLPQRRLWLAGSGIALGFSLASKWNGLGFLSGIYLVWGIAWLFKKILAFRLLRNFSSLESRLSGWQNRKPFNQLAQLSWLDLACDLGFIPVLVYCLLWIPHFLQFPSPGFVQLHLQSFAFHKGVGSGADVHPYCSRWYTWPLMLRPVAYYFDRANSGSQEIYHAVQGTGNPVLWWISTIAILLILGRFLGRIRSLWTQETAIALPPSSALVHFFSTGARRIRTLVENSIPQPERNQNRLSSSQIALNFWVPVYLLCNYAANLLPWVRVSRCTFLYHYLEASVFAFLALAWVIDCWLRGNDLFLRVLAALAIVSILLAFLFWLPIYLGLPLSPEAFQRRMWLRSWI